MKKIILMAVILGLTAGTLAWAQSTTPVAGKNKGQLLHEQYLTQHPHHQKGYKPPRKIEGTAVKGAKQVSPLVVKNK
jgi:hypothetical protein